jgi:hypothetical protein
MDQFGYDNDFEGGESVLAWNIREEEDPPEAPYDSEPSEFDFYVCL